MRNIQEKNPDSYINKFSVGEFSKICGVKSDTLRYYDSIELLTPINIAPNGYREYSVGQIFNFELISILKSLNMPLDAIRELFKEESIEVLEQILNEKIIYLDSEIDRLTRMKDLITRLSGLSKLHKSVPCGTPFIEKRERENLILSDQRTNVNGEFIPIITNHFKKCREINYGVKYPMGGILKYERFSLGDFDYPDRYFTVAFDSVPKELTFEKPKGFYAVIFHQGFYSTVGESCKKLLDFVDEIGWKVIGDLYENDLISNFRTKNRTDFKMEISIQVGKDI